MTQSKQELTEIEQGKEIIGVDETVLDHLAIDQKSSDLKTQLNQQFHRASIVIGTSDSFWYQKSDHNYIRSNSSTSQQAVDSPATSRKKLASSSQHSLESVSPPPQHGDSSSSPSYSTPIRKSSKLFESVRENESEEMNDPHEDDYDEDEEQDTYSNDISPLTYQSNMRGLESIPSPQRLNFRLNSMAEEQNDDDEEGNESDERYSFCSLLYFHEI